MITETTAFFINAVIALTCIAVCLWLIGLSIKIVLRGKLYGLAIKSPEKFISAMLGPKPSHIHDQMQAWLIDALEGRNRNATKAPTALERKMQEMQDKADADRKARATSSQK